MCFEVLVVGSVRGHGVSVVTRVGKSFYKRSQTAGRRGDRLGGNPFENDLARMGFLISPSVFPAKFLTKPSGPLKILCGGSNPD